MHSRDGELFAYHVITGISTSPVLENHSYECNVIVFAKIGENSLVKMNSRQIKRALISGSFELLSEEEFEDFKENTLRKTWPDGADNLIRTTPELEQLVLQLEV